MEIQVNSVTDLPFTGEYFSGSPRSQNGYVVSWEKHIDSNGVPRIVYQRFAPDGSLVSSPVIVALDNQTHVPHAVQLANGFVAVAWEFQTNGYKRIELRVFDENDQLVYSGIASQRPADDYRNVRIIDIGDGRFGVYSMVHDQFPQTNPFAQSIRLFDYTGQPSSNEVFVVNGFSHNLRNAPLILPNGDISITYYDMTNKTLVTSNIAPDTLLVKWSTIVHGFNSDPIGNIEQVCEGDEITVSYQDSSSVFVAKIAYDGTLIKTYEVLSTPADVVQISCAIPGFCLVVYSRGSQTYARLIDLSSGDTIKQDVFIGNGTIAVEGNIQSTEEGRFSVFLTSATPQNSTVSLATLVEFSIEPPNEAPVGEVLITGSAVAGQKVYVDISEVSDGDGLGSFVSFAWYLDGEYLAEGRTETTNILNTDYPLFASDVGKTLTVQYSFYDARGKLETVTSNGVIIQPLSSINGTSGNDTLNGSALDDSITGLAGNDQLSGIGGSDTLSGGKGNDIYIVDGNDLVLELAAEGTDEVRSSGSFVMGANIERLVLTGFSDIDGEGNSDNNSINGNSGSNLISGSSGNDTLLGYAGNDTLDGGAGNDSLIGGSGSDVLTGGAGNDIYVVDAGDTITEITNAGTDTVQSYVSFTLGQNIENLTLVGTNSIYGYGNTLNNVITGNGAANILYGGTGADTLIGGAGNDTYVTDGGDTITEAANAGTDTVQSSVAHTLGTNVENLTLTGAGAINGTGNTLNNMIVGNGAANTLDGGDGNDVLNGGLGNDFLFGGLGSDSVLGGAGVDALEGNSGNDTLWGGSESDSVGGQDGNDVLYGDDGDDQLWGNAGDDYLNGGAGNDIIFGGNGLSNPNLAGADSIVGDGRDTLVGGDGSDILHGLGEDDSLDGGGGNDAVFGEVGNDTLNGGAGADTLVGGAGNDTYVTDGGDTITEAANAGTDTVQSSVTYTLGADLENLTLVGTGAISGTGNELNNAMVGNSAANTLNGGDGSDTLDGGSGTDTLVGGAGNDTYVTDGGDTITEAANAGIDTVQSSVTISIAANVENLTLTGTGAIDGTGNSLNNIIVGNAGNNVLDGGAGTDTLVGGDGNDRLFGGDGDDELFGGAGNDTISDGYGIDLIDGGTGIDTFTRQYDGVDYSIVLAFDLARGLAHLPSAPTTAGEYFVSIENVTVKGGYTFIINGSAANNILEADAGNDTLDGGTGTDTLIGGTGNDTYVTDGGDTITEAANAGIDTVQSSVTISIAANVENLTLTGTGAIDGTGNSLNNVVSGNSGNNVLNGGTGADTLVGGAGNDTYMTDGGDTITEAANAGTDTVQSAVAHTLGANVENLTLTGTGAINGTGNSLNNVLTGNSGNNVLSGGTGADTLVGGAGDDTYVTDGGDTITEAANAGTDTVQSSVAHTLGTNVENLTLTGTGAIAGTGNTLNNLIVGNSAANTLYGATGADTVTGGAGNDTFVFKSVAETTILATTTDIITDFVQGQDKINLADVDAFAGTSANDAFVWKGTAAFASTTQGEVRYDKFDNTGTANDYTMVWIDNDNDTVVEMAIRLTGLYNLAASDFIL